VYHPVDSLRKHQYQWAFAGREGRAWPEMADDDFVHAVEAATGEIKGQLEHLCLNSRPICRHPQEARKALREMSSILGYFAAEIGESATL
jgi:hypothetical protein